METKILPIILITIAVLAHSVTEVSAHDDWSLTGLTGPGPAKWADTWPICNGSGQTPIDIPANSVYDPTLTPFSFSGYETFGPGDMEVVNVGYTAEVHIKEGSIGNAYFTGGPYAGKYLASIFHFHWGPEDQSGSDHSFRGKFYPAELHLGHFKADYGNIYAASQYPDGPQGLAFWFELSDDDNPALEPYIDALENIEYEGQRHPVELSLDKLMPEDTSKFCQYNGSMPIPPCKEDIIWTVFKDTNTISSAQLSRLRQLYDSASDATHPVPHQIEGNQRGIQPLGNRIVRCNFEIDDDDDDSDSSSSDNDD